MSVWAGMWWSWLLSLVVGWAGSEGGGLGASVYGHRERVRSAKHEFVFGAGIGSVCRSEGESPAEGGQDHRGLVVGIRRPDAVSVAGAKGDVCVAVRGSTPR